MCAAGEPLQEKGGGVALSRGVVRAARIGAVAIVFLAFAGGALAQERDLTERARSLLREGKPQAAYDLLEPRADELNDAESAYLLGIAALDIGKAGLAVMAFERSLAYDPGYAIARAELARALIQVGETDQARLELARLQTAEVPPQVKPRLQALQKALAELVDVARRRTSGVSWYIEGETGYDSNINTGANSRTFPIPLFGGANVTLATIFQKHDSAFVGGGAGFVAYNEVRPGLRVFGGFDGRLRYDLREFNDGEYHTSLWSGNGGLRWQSGRHTVTGALTVLENRVVSQVFDQQWGAYGNWQYQVDPYNELGVFGQWLDMTHPVQRSLDTTFRLIGAGWRHGFEAKGAPVLTGALYYGDDDEKGSDPAVGRRILGGRLAYEQRLDIGARLVASYARQKSTYGGENIFFFRIREDTRHDFSLGLAFSPAKDVTLTPQYLLTRNKSNIPVVDFTRHQLLVTLRRDFY